MLRATGWKGNDSKVLESVYSTPCAIVPVSQTLPARQQIMTMEHIATCDTPATFSFADMHRFASEAWGPLGTDTVNKWAEFNQRYFGGLLRPVPVVITHTQPFGKRIAFCSITARATPVAPSPSTCPRIT